MQKYMIRMHGGLICQGLEKCLGLDLSTSRSRLGPKIEHLGLGKSGIKVSVLPWTSTSHVHP